MKKNLRRLAPLFLLATISFSLAVLSGCRGHMPEAPRTDLCIHSVEQKGFWCLKPDGSNYFLEYVKASDYIAQSQQDMKLWDIYVLELEREVTNCRHKP